MNEQRLLDTFFDLVKLPCPSGHEAQAAAYCKEALEACGCTVEIDDVGEKIGSDTGNLYAVLPGTAPGSIIMTAHLDCVQPCEGVNPRIVDGVIRSDGTTILGGDDKVGVASIIEAVRSLVEEGGSYSTVKIIFSVQEEVGCCGAREFSRGSFEAGEPCYVFDAEGDVGLVCLAAPFYYSFEARFSGKASHAGVAPQDGISAINAAAAAIEKGIDFTYECKGVEYIDGKKITCVEDHGTQNLEEAFANSCNTYFAMLSQKLDHEDLERWADLGMYDHEFVFTDMTLYSGHYELSSYAPDTAWAAIGQYKDLVTPMQNCMIAAAIANDGRMLEPKLLKSIDGTIYSPSVNVISSMPSEITDRVRDFMRKTVEEGTATNAQISGYDVCGKTGTAEYNDEGEKKNHSWFIGFIDDDQHPLAVSIILEGAGYGSKYATPLAKKALSYALDKGY